MTITGACAQAKYESISSATCQAISSGVINLTTELGSMRVTIAP